MCLFPYGKSGLKFARTGGPKNMLTGLFPYGKSGLKSVVRGRAPQTLGLFPYGKSGLKSGRCILPGWPSGSLPVWEEWIEIWMAAKLRRGMSSLPVWEEWIEMRVMDFDIIRSPSLPVWEEWIEISPFQSTLPTRGGLFPYGKSGLKSSCTVSWLNPPCLFPYGKSGLKWIILCWSCIRTARLFPYGKSGLKYLADIVSCK